MKNDMQQVQRAALDELLKMWHRWQSHYSPAIGYTRTAAGCDMYRASRQYDDQNGAIDDDADASLCQAIDSEVQRIAEPHRAALYMEARNLCSLRVWRSARLDAERAAEIVAEARVMLWARLMRAGLV